MGITTKLRVARIVSWACLLIALLIVIRMVPLGLAGEAGKVKFYFAFFILSVIAGVAATLLYYYLKSKIRTYDLSTDIEMKTLAQSGQRIREKDEREV